MIYHYNVDNCGVFVKRAWLLKGIKKAIKISNSDINRNLSKLSKDFQNRYNEIDRPQAKVILKIADDLKYQLKQNPGVNNFVVFLRNNGKPYPLFSQLPNDVSFYLFIHNNGEANFCKNYLGDLSDLKNKEGQLVLKPLTIG